MNYSDISRIITTQKDDILSILNNDIKSKGLTGEWKLGQYMFGTFSGGGHNYTTYSSLHFPYGYSESQILNTNVFLYDVPQMIYLYSFFYTSKEDNKTYTMYNYYDDNEIIVVNNHVVGISSNITQSSNNIFTSIEWRSFDITDYVVDGLNTVSVFQSNALYNGTTPGFIEIQIKDSYNEWVLPPDQEQFYVQFTHPPKDFNYYPQWYNIPKSIIDLIKLLENNDDTHICSIDSDMIVSGIQYNFDHDNNNNFYYLPTYDKQCLDFYQKNVKTINIESVKGITPVKIPHTINNAYIDNILISEYGVQINSYKGLDNQLTKDVDITIGSSTVETDNINFLFDNVDNIPFLKSNYAYIMYKLHYSVEQIEDTNDYQVMVNNIHYNLNDIGDNAQIQNRVSKLNKNVLTLKDYLDYTQVSVGDNIQTIVNKNITDDFFYQQSNGYIIDFTHTNKIRLILPFIINKDIFVYLDDRDYRQVNGFDNVHTNIYSNSFDLDTMKHIGYNVNDLIVNTDMNYYFKYYQTPLPLVYYSYNKNINFSISTSMITNFKSIMIEFEQLNGFSNKYSFKDIYIVYLSHNTLSLNSFV